MKQRLLLNQLKKINKPGLFIIGLVFSFNLVAQDPNVTPPSPSSVNNPTTIPAQTTNSATEEVNMGGKKVEEIKDLGNAPDGTEQAADELAQKQEELNKKYQMLYQGATPKKVDMTKNLDHEYMIKKMAMELNHDLTPDKVKKMKISEAVAFALAPIQAQTEKEILYQLLNNAKGTKNYDLMINYPKITLFVVRMIKDKEALPYATKILENKKKLINFAAVMISSVLVGFLVARFVRTKSKSFGKVFLLFLLRVFLMMGLRIGIIIFFFGEELYPLYRVFLNTFI